MKTQNLPYELHPSVIHCLWPVLQGLRPCSGHSWNKPLQRKAMDLSYRVDRPRSGKNCQLER